MLNSQFLRGKSTASHFIESGIPIKSLVNSGSQCLHTHIIYTRGTGGASFQILNSISTSGHRWKTQFCTSILVERIERLQRKTLGILGQFSSPPVSCLVVLRRFEKTEKCIPTPLHAYAIPSQ